MTKASLKQLQASWYGRLKKEGFEDIEQQAGSTDAKLKSWHSHYFQARHEPTAFEAKENYYYQACQYLECGEFQSKTHRHVWKLHSEGLGLRKIAVVLKKSGQSFNKDQLGSMIRSIKEEMAGRKPVKKEEEVWKQMSLFENLI